MNGGVNSLLIPSGTAFDLFVIRNSKKNIPSECVCKSRYFFCDFLIRNPVIFELKVERFIKILLRYHALDICRYQFCPFCSVYINHYSTPFA